MRHLRAGELEDLSLFVEEVGWENLAKWEREVLESTNLSTVSSILSEKQLLDTIRRCLGQSPPSSPADKRPNSPRAAFTTILRQWESWMEEKFSQMLQSKTADILDSVGATTESMLQASEINLLSKLSN